MIRSINTIQTRKNKEGKLKQKKVLRVVWYEKSFCNKQKNYVRSYVSGDIEPVRVWQFLVVRPESDL